MVGIAKQSQHTRERQMLYARHKELEDTITLQWMVVLLLMSGRCENGNLHLSPTILPLSPMDYPTIYNKLPLLLMDWLA